jgi:dipeptidyl-peptidase-4
MKKIDCLIYRGIGIPGLILLMVAFWFVPGVADSQIWTPDGNAYYMPEDNIIIKYTLPQNKPDTIVKKSMLIPSGMSVPLDIDNFSISSDGNKILIFTNTKKVWRLRTRGDYWLLDRNNGSLRQLGKTLPSSSLMFAKLSPDGQRAAYVSHNNIYIEDLQTSSIKPLTTDGTETLINGTFDWVYEEEFFCRDGFRWSPDSKKIAYWQLDASEIGKFYMINNTDSIHPRIIPIEYPLVGEKPSACRVGVANIDDAKTTWINIPGEPDQNYIVRMEFIPWSQQLLIHQLNRKQNEGRLFIADPISGTSRSIFQETDKAFIEAYFDAFGEAYQVDFAMGFRWLPDRRSIIWTSEKEGWKQLYEISTEGKPERKITQGNYDVIEFKGMEANNKFVYFTASPENATQKYLYRLRFEGKGKLELMSSPMLKGTHDYDVSPGAKYAFHSFSNYHTRSAEELITLSDGKTLNHEKTIAAMQDSLKVKTTMEFFTITTADGVTMDGWMVKPVNFDSTKKYPVVFEVYTEPASTTVNDEFGIGYNYLYAGNMAADGYIYMSFDNRGTPAPKGSEWRKSIYRKVGILNIHDQAQAATEILKWKFVDPDRIAVWGWSGGGGATLNLMFQYPEIYKTGIAIASVTNELTYDNVYTERYMGLPQENMEDYEKGSPLYYAKNLKGNLLIIHGTGDDNVHYQNAEMLVNELIKYNKRFQIMPYPNRTHSISEGQGTFMHLRTTYTDFLKKNCPPGAR